MDILERYRNAWKEQDVEPPRLAIPEGGGKLPVSWMGPLRNAIRKELIINAVLCIALLVPLILLRETLLLGGLFALFVLSLFSLIFQWGLWKLSGKLAKPGENLLTYSRKLLKRLKLMQRTYVTGGLVLANLMFAGAAITGFFIISQQATVLVFKPGLSLILFVFAMLLLVNALTYASLRRWYQLRFRQEIAKLERWYAELRE